MRRFTVILFLLLTGMHSAFAIHSFVNESKVWHYKKWKQGFVGQEDKYYFYQGDTVINGITAKKMYLKFDKESNKGNYQASLYEDGQKVYCCYPNKKDFELLYDFGAKKGEEVTISNITYVMEDVEEIKVGDEALRILYLSYTEGDEKFQFTWVQGFGGESIPLNSNPKLTGSYENFICCEMDGKVVLEGEDILKAIATPKTNNPNIQVHASTLHCTAPDAVKLAVYTMDAIKVGGAHFVDGEATVKVGEAPAMYFYIVTYPDGRRESGKARVSEE